MLIPFVSVSAIGLFVALRRQSSGVGVGPLAGAGLVGAWVGFLLGSVVGAVVEVLLFGALWPFLLGHVGAVAGSRLTVANRTRTALVAGH